MNANTPFRSLLANRYSPEAACLCGSVLTQRGQIVGLRSGQIKPIQSQKRENQKNTGQAGLDGTAQSKCGLLSPDFFSVHLTLLTEAIQVGAV